MQLSRFEDSHSDWLVEIRSTMRETLKRLIAGRPVAYLDLPTHMNVGDSMIWLGTRHNLESIGARVVLEADIDSFRDADLKATPTDTVILMHGGGNYGDVWPRFQEFREYIAREFHDHRIVQLPQTVFFRGQQGYRRAADIFGSHPDYTLMVRDDASFKRVAECIPALNSVRVPDFALGIEARPLRPIVGRPPLLLARGDQESSKLIDSVRPHLSQFDEADWGDSWMQRTRWSVGRLPLVLSAKIPASHKFMRPLFTRSMRSILQTNIHAANDLIGGRPFLVTDRLHAHVYAGLNNIPHIVLDNNYGKISSVFDSYTHQFPTATLVRSPQEMEAAVAQLTSNSRLSDHRARGGGGQGRTLE